jgi:site-specific DNA recombinase
MGIKSITTHLNERNIRTRDGGRWGIASVRQILTRTTYIGEHRFNARDQKTRAAKPEAEHAVMEVPPIITEAEYHAVKAALKARSPQWMPPRAVSGPTLLTGICFCASCGGAMRLRNGKGSQYRYYTCSTKARQGESGFEA